MRVMHHTFQGIESMYTHHEAFEPSSQVVQKLPDKRA